MAETEVRSRIEGNLYWVQASGQGKTWVTASGATTALMAYISNFSWTTAQNLAAVNDRGVPDHWKKLDTQPVQLSFTVNEALTAQMPNPSSGGGASVPLLHMEFKQSVPEDAAMTGIYYQFMGVPFQSMQFNEGDQNTRQYTTQALAMNGPTGSGRIG